MTLPEFRAYVADKAKDGNPAIEAARAVLADRDRLADRLGNGQQIAGLKAQIEELEADVKSYRRENERLRTELAKLQPALWETK